ncbi:Unknown protein [Striga hermonthica]|uniref:Uncharacterized protein n=1 Tax=Striga hermonthica TaxID=68872 RepID=A0A9N7R8N4_STRHE|nr:Unknown protein [Striga hermonthica]
MENSDKFSRFSSCRGVAFEIKPHADPFAVPNRVTNRTRDSSTRPGANSSRWLPFGSISRIFTSSELIQKTMSRTSSHFCDIETEEQEEDCDTEDDDETLAKIEEGHPQNNGNQSPQPLLIIPPTASKRRQTAAKPKPSRLSIILLDQGLFTVYKRLLFVCVALNVMGLNLAANGHFPYARARPALFSIANVFALVLCRSEAFLRLIFWAVVAAFGHSWVPLRLKTMTTSLLQSLGGIHSGCGISSIVWLVYALVLAARDGSGTPPEAFGVAAAILGLLALSALAAFPLLRHLHHNVFERTHRFAGWAALVLLWAFAFLTVSYNPRTESYRDEFGSRLVRSQEFWFTLATTVLIVVPWLTVRKVKVQVSSPSGHAAIIKFEGGVKSGILGRISPSPFSEWHAFGIISDGKKEHMMLAGAVGDFTKSLVSNPPTHLWVRQVHFAGLPYLTNMYGRALLVATGSGICVFLSFLLQPSAAEVCVLWVTKGVEENYGTEIKGWMSEASKAGKVIVHDTAVMGRPNVAEMSVKTAKGFGAEVVIVTSNPEGSRDVVDACKAAGFAAFGPIWDS